MRKGHVILILAGLALLAFLIFSPVTPPSEAAAVEGSQSATDSVQLTDPDAMVDEALEELQDGTTPPMQAILKIRKVAEDYPDNLKAQFTLGVLSLQTGQYERATERFAKVLALDSSRGEYWRLMAEARLGTGDTVEARKNFEKALQLVNEETGDRFKKELPALDRN